VSDEDTIGLIFPILPHHVKRFFEDKKSVFVKFTGRGLSARKLQSASRLFFYESGRCKEIVGEARIVEKTTGTADEVLAKYGNDLFLTPRELEVYTANRRTQGMLTLVLRDAKRYEIPLRLHKGLTMAGQYMTGAMYRKLKEVLRVKEQQA